MKIVQWERGCTMRADRQTDGQKGIHDEANRCFSQFCESAYNYEFCQQVILV